LTSTTDTIVGNVDPDNNIDASVDVTADENGIDDPAPNVKGITSQPITLAPDTEPASVSDGNGTNSNLTVDFGLVYYDLALIKTRSAGQGYAIDSSNNPPTASYDIVVENQGPTAVAATTVLDTIPTGMSLISVDGVALAVPATGTHTMNITNLAAGSRITMTLVMQVDDLSQGSYINIAEISDMRDQNNLSVPDIDSTADITPTNDAIDTSPGIDLNGQNDDKTKR